MKEKIKIDWKWRNTAAFIAQALLALTSCKGIYEFERHFKTDEFWSTISSVAVEATYLSLILFMGLGQQGRLKANLVAFTAMALSLIFNTMANYFEMSQNLYSLGLAFVKSAPFPVLSFAMASLILHSNTKLVQVQTKVEVSKPKPQPAKIEPVAIIESKPEPKPQPEVSLKSFDLGFDFEELEVLPKPELPKPKPNLQVVPDIEGKPSTETRRAFLAEIVKSGEKINKTELARIFQVSPTAIAKDLNYLIEKGA